MGDSQKFLGQVMVAIINRVDKTMDKNSAARYSWHSEMILLLMFFVTLREFTVFLPLIDSYLLCSPSIFLLYKRLSMWPH